MTYSVQVISRVGAFALLALAFPSAQAQVWAYIYEEGQVYTSLGLFGSKQSEDFDGDGFPDALTTVRVDDGDGFESRVLLVSGQDGSTLAEYPGVFHVQASPDLDGDNVPDVWGVRLGEDSPSYILLSGASLLGDGPSEVLTEFIRPGGGFGGRVLTAGLDVTGDGVPDLMGVHDGLVWLYSGAALAAGGTTAASVFAPPQQDIDDGAYFDPGRNSLAEFVADLDGDGRADLLVADPSFDPPGVDQDIGVVYAFSSATGAVLFRQRAPLGYDDFAFFGENGLAVIGGTEGPGAGPDIDGDGVPEIIISTESAASIDGSNGVVGIYAGATGDLLREVRMADPTWRNGFGNGSLLILPDIDGDGVADFAVPSTLNPAEGEYGLSAVLAFSSATGEELWRLTNPSGEVRSRFGFGYLASAGDLDGDGRVELFVADIHADVGERENVGVLYAVSSPVPVAAEPSVEAERLSLSVSPNPSREASWLSFELPSAGAVRLSLHDVLGREVAVLADGARSAGPHRVATPPGLAPGVYVARLVADSGVATRTLAIVR